MMIILFIIFLKLTIESKNIELFCTQFLPCVNVVYFTFSFYAYLDYNHL
jgi:hypothetical protein